MCSNGSLKLLTFILPGAFAKEGFEKGKSRFIWHSGIKVKYDVIRFGSFDGKGLKGYNPVKFFHLEFNKIFL